MDTIKHKKYNYKYKEKFLAEKKKLESILNSSNTRCTIEHIGSTSVPNLDGKGIIDIAITIEDFSKIGEFVEILTKRGFFYKETAGSEERFFFSDKSLNDNNVNFHYHVMPKNSETYKNSIKFRDLLRKNNDLAGKYYNLKKKLSIQVTDPKEYLKGKKKFIENVLNSN